MPRSPSMMLAMVLQTRASSNMVPFQSQMINSGFISPSPWIVELSIPDLAPYCKSKHLFTYYSPNGGPGVLPRFGAGCILL